MCSLERIGSVCVLRLTGETEHRFSPSLCAEIRENLAIAARSDARALVTTNEGKFFSNGLDLEWALSEEKESEEEEEESETRVAYLLRELEGVVLDLLKLNMPTYAAICGHAAAAGLLFAMAHDHRIMRSDRGFLYSAAIDINFVLPPGSAALFRAKASPKAFKDMVLAGVKYTGIMACDAGLVDSLQPDAASTFDETVKEATRFAQRPWERAAYAALRAAMYPHLIHTLDQHQHHDSNSISGGFLTKPLSSSS